MERRRAPAVGRNRNVFKGSVLVSLLVESHPSRFPDRKAACALAKKLFQDGHIRSIFQVSGFEDSAQLYVWHDDHAHLPTHRQGAMTSPTSSSYSAPGKSSSVETSSSAHKHPDWKLIQDVKEKVLNRSEAYNIVTSYNTFFQELERDFGYDHNALPAGHLQGGSDARVSGKQSKHTPYTSTLELKRESTYYSTDSSADINAQYGDSRLSSGPRKGKKSSAFHLASSKQNSGSQPSKSQSSKNISPYVSTDTSPQISKNLSPISTTDSSHSTLKPTPPHIKQQLLQNHKYHYQHSHHVHSNHRRVQLMNSNTGPISAMSGHKDYAMVSSEERPQNSNTEMVLPSGSGQDLVDLDVGSNQHGTTSSQVSSVIGSNQHGTTSSQVSSVATESMDNTPVNTGSSRGTNRWKRDTSDASQHPVAPTHNDFPNWLNPDAPHAAKANTRWEVDNEVQNHRGGTGLDTRGSGWPEAMVREAADNGRQWPESTYSYSDNEKQLLEEMRRMKKEHQNTLRTYEGRINKLMAKMHELRNIAEMLENSSSKSSPYGVLPGKLALLNALVEKEVEGNKGTGARPGGDQQIPPPLPPRPGRGSRVYPNKPIIRTSVTMRELPWSRIILEDNGSDQTVWHGMTEPKIDTEELEQMFSEAASVSEEVNLFDDICLRKGRAKSQSVSIYDTDRSQRIISELRALRCTLPDIIQAFVTLNSEGLHTDSFAELLELLTSERELDKILQHVKRKGASYLDVPEYLVFELSKVDHFRERLEFLRFKNKLQINLFEIDQQLRELHTACDEITTSISLKHVLETVLAVGNHMNGGSEKGQADGFKVEVLNSLKDMQDRSKRSNLLELIMRIYCCKFENDLDFGCPTRFRLPEPSNMRHAAQVSFEDIQRALKELKDELMFVRNKLERLSKREGSNLTLALRVTSENFMTSAVEVLAEKQKLLEDTRGHFCKTVIHFSLDGQRVSPHDFFQTWASFLHDCKYYWKLAHRNLAKVKFNGDLATKSQLSCSSMPGFNNLKSVMMKHVASFQQDEEMRASKVQQLQHINSWIESVGRYVMEMQPEQHPNPELSQRSSSPHRTLQAEQQQAPTSHYANRPVIPPLPHLETVNSDCQRNLQNSNSNSNRNTGGSGNYNNPGDNRSRHHVRGESTAIPQAPASPKPIKAIPPNVIKPQPILHTSPTMSSPSPTSPNIHLAQPLSLVPIHLTGPVEDSDDTFGFEPPYETLSTHQHTKSDTDNCHSYPGSNNSGFQGETGQFSPEVDGVQKKNANVFKSFLKKDKKRLTNTIPDDSHHNASSKSGSTPFNKLKNTFVQKLSGSGGSKKTSNESLKSVGDTPPKPPRGLSLDNEPHSVRELQDSDGQHGNPDADNVTSHVSYQNYYYPGQPRRPEDHQKAREQERIPSGNLAQRGGHDSLPSTISSVQSFRDYPLSQTYRGQNNRDKDGSHGKAGFNKNTGQEGPVNDVNNNYEADHADGNVNSDRAHRARVRAPIALGSNMSISDVYGKATEAALKESENSGIDGGGGGGNDHSDLTCPQQELSSDRDVTEPLPKIPGPQRPTCSDPKWVKANAVPVYQAKLIPNYENQTKLDLRLEGGVRGQAEAPVKPVHMSQASNSSDVYRQELLKKSEQFIAGGIYPSIGHAGGSGSLPGMPTSYTVLPFKPLHYHASPIVLSQSVQRDLNPSVDVASNSNAHGSAITMSDHYGTDSSIPPSTKIDGGDHGNVRLSQNYQVDHQLDGKGRSGVSLNREGKLQAEHADNWQSQKQGEAAVVHREGPNHREGANHKSGANHRDGTNHREGATRRDGASHRSASAHSIIDKDYETLVHERTSKSSRGSPGSQHSRSRGRTSRRDDTETKVTPTSHKEASDGRGSGGSQSVFSLIDKFEKKPDGKGVGLGLLDIDDKPPSMTSTPVSRRKNQSGASSSHDINGHSSVPRTDRENNRSRSASGRSNRQTHPISGASGHDGHHSQTRDLAEGKGRQHHHTHNLQSHAVAPFHFQPSPSGTQHQSPPTQSHAVSEHYSENHYKRQQREQGLEHVDHHQFVPGSLKSDQQYSDSPSRSAKGGHIPTQSHTSGQRGQVHTPSERARSSDHSQSSSSKRSSSQGHRATSAYSTPLASASSSSQVSSYHSSFLPKPEPQYPTHQQNYVDSSAPNHHHHQHHHHHHRHHQQQQQQQHAYQPGIHHQQSSSHNHQHLQSHLSSPQSLQQQSNNNGMVNTPNNKTVAYENNKYSDELRRTSKSTSSAFDRPVKVSPSYVRQPGAMAVVKPTVMHL